MYVSNYSVVFKLIFNFQLMYENPERHSLTFQSYVQLTMTQLHVAKPTSDLVDLKVRNIQFMNAWNSTGSDILFCSRSGYGAQLVQLPALFRWKPVAKWKVGPVRVRRLVRVVQLPDLRPKHWPGRWPHCLLEDDTGNGLATCQGTIQTGREGNTTEVKH